MLALVLTSLVKTKLYLKRPHAGYPSMPKAIMALKGKNTELVDIEANVH